MYCLVWTVATREFDIKTFLINLENVWKNVQNGKPPSSLASLLIRKMFWGSNPSRPCRKIKSWRHLLLQQPTLFLRKVFCAWLLTCGWQGKHLSALSLLHMSMGECVTRHHGKKKVTPGQRSLRHGRGHLDNGCSLVADSAWHYDQSKRIAHTCSFRCADAHDGTPQHFFPIFFLFLYLRAWFLPPS